MRYINTLIDNYETISTLLLNKQIKSELIDWLYEQINELIDKQKKRY